MFRLIHATNGQVVTSATLPVYDAAARVWRCSDVDMVDLDGTTFQLPDDNPEPSALAGPVRTAFPPPTFLLLFTGAERVAIRAARAYTGADAVRKQAAAVLNDWFSIIEDPRLVSIDVANPSTRDGLAFLVSVGLLTAERKAEIEAGVAA